uniref:Uncharacterized protein n=1 Tax=Utricularia reniformis TaxID=192314 RepID=A0A1Y0B0M0_9LAMI|nr:hypothetical protein AEK19_MT0748 [Utricularia reniformis]ART30992.1 hypothetical protein AEK19_MT0748 [Utricularia reniformis]
MLALTQVNRYSTTYLFALSFYLYICIRYPLYYFIFFRLYLSRTTQNEAVVDQYYNIALSVSLPLPISNNIEIRLS